MTRGHLQALIFDCDGVLVDTERDGHRVAFNKAFSDLGLDAQWSIERYGALLKIAGGKERMTRHFDETRWPVAESERGDLIKKLHERKTAIFMELLDAGGMVLRPGVARLVDEAIAAKIPIAVCSTSAERAVNAVVTGKLGSDRARHIKVFAGDIVKRKKPDPEIYNLAAKVLAVNPKQCVVIEDSQNGLEAAKAAGMNCIVTISSYTSGEDFSLADRVVADLDAGIDMAECRALVNRRSA
jgi:HAD superfamily hydrolase (TIGR01509 family)